PHAHLKQRATDVRLDVAALWLEELGTVQRGELVALDVGPAELLKRMRAIIPDNDSRLPVAVGEPADQQLALPQRIRLQPVLRPRRRVRRPVTACPARPGASCTPGASPAPGGPGRSSVWRRSRPS